MAAILHKVKRGDTITSICLLYDLNYQRLIDLNLRFLHLNVLDTHEIRPGWSIVIGDSADPLDLVRIMRVHK